MSTYSNHQRQVEELYFDDPLVDNETYGRMLEEAHELDRADEHNAERLSYWEARAAKEEGEPS